MSTGKKQEVPENELKFELRMEHGGKAHSHAKSFTWQKLNSTIALVRCDLRPLHFPSLHLRRNSRIVSTVLVSSNTYLLGLKTLLLYITLTVSTNFLIVRLWPVWTLTPPQKIAHRVELFFFSFFVFVFGFVSTLPHRNDFVPSARRALVIRLVRLWFHLSCFKGSTTQRWIACEAMASGYLRPAEWRIHARSFYWMLPYHYFKHMFGFLHASWIFKLAYRTGS